MKKIIILLIILLSASYMFCKESSIRFNGSLDTAFEMNHSKYFSNDAGPYQGQFTWGLKNLANLRFKADLGEYLSFSFAINIHTLSGTFTDPYKIFYKTEAHSLVTLASTLKIDYNHGFFSIPFFYKSTYIGSFELERLYFKAGNDYFDIQAGLLRLAHGFGYDFSPTDLFNPRNPLDPTARPEGRLAFIATFYPADLWKIELFSVLPDNPVETRGWGFKFGASTNFSIKKFNFEFLYALFMPDIEFNKDPNDLGLPEYTRNSFTHIAGFSMKADIEIGLYIDMIYRFDQRELYWGKYYGKTFYGYEGLEAAIGIDYTFAGGRVYALLEYMFYGSGILGWGKSLNGLYTTNDWWKEVPLERLNLLKGDKNPQIFLRHDYIFGLIRVKVNDFLNLGVSYLFGADDQSAVLSPFAEIEPFQFFSINVSAMYPFDWRMLNESWDIGELGSTNIGYFQKYTIIVKVSF